MTDADERAPMHQSDTWSGPAGTSDFEHLVSASHASRPHSPEEMVAAVLSSGRYFILLAVLGSFLTSCAVLVYAFFAGVVDSFGEAIQHEFDADGAKHVSVEVITLVDLFLLGTVLHVIAVGLYQLFVDPDLPTPGWLKITDLDELKERLLGTIVVLLAVSFLGYVVTWDGSFSLLGVGGAIGVVLLALSLLLRQFRQGVRRAGSDREGEAGRAPPIRPPHPANQHDPVLTAAEKDESHDRKNE